MGSVEFRPFTPNRPRRLPVPTSRMRRSGAALLPFPTIRCCSERRALRDRKNELAHRRRILTRFDTWEDDSWLDPDRSGPPNSNLNQLYDDTDLVDDAEERLMAARAEHAEMGDNALDGSQLSEMLAGQGLFSYPGEDLISDGLSHLAGAIHNI